MDKLTFGDYGIDKFDTSKEQISSLDGVYGTDHHLENHLFLFDNAGAHKGEKIKKLMTETRKTRVSQTNEAFNQWSFIDTHDPRFTRRSIDILNVGRCKWL